MRGAALSILGVLAAGGPAVASTFSISPIRIELSAGHNTAIVTVRNQEETTVSVQAQAEAWTQPGGRDQLADTRDLLVTPPIFTLAPKGEQILRIALLRQPDPARELDYRLVLAEIPAAAPQNFTGLRVALRVTLPTFVAAAAAHTAPDVAWRHRWLPDGTLLIDAENRGTAHIQIRDFDVQVAAGAGEALHADDARYVLPGSTVEWRLPPHGSMPHAARLTLHGHSDDGDFTVTSDSGAP
jgi:fimbrial chaperone protein